MIQKSLRFVYFCLFSVVIGLAFAGGVRAEEIDRFSVEATLTSNRRLTIEETIDYDFGAARRHGMLRTLPERYRRWLLNYDLHYTIESVTMDGKEVPWEKEDQGRDLQLRIGDPDRTITGKHQYKIRYRTDRAINDFLNSRELYWNVTGNSWPAPIDHAMFRFEGVPVVRQKCFTGVVGSTEEACVIRTSADGSVTVEAPGYLNPNEGLTVVLEFQKAALASESIIHKLLFLLRDNFFTLLPLFLCLVMVGVWYVWGRDPRGRGVVIPHYEAPDNLTPGLMAGLHDQEISSRGMSATLLDLARRGFTKLELVGKNPEQPEKVLYRRLPDPTKDTLAPYEKEVLEGVFKGDTEVNLKRPSSDGQWAAYQKMIKLMTDEMIARGWFVKNPGAVRGGWVALAFVILVFAVMASYPLYILLAGVVGVLGWYMPKMTTVGAEVHERVLGFRHFLMVTEKDRLAFSDAPAKRPEQFAEFLPAAVALGVEKEWAKQFEGMLVAPPSYIQGAGMNWGSLAYVHAVTTMSHSVAAGMTHQTSSGSGSSGFSSGGGSSGGGFGGGGGGSW